MASNKINAYLQKEVKWQDVEDIAIQKLQTGADEQQLFKQWFKGKLNKPEGFIEEFIAEMMVSKFRSF